MPKIGLSGMFVAEYNESAGAVTYSKGTRYGRARSFSTSITTSDDNDYYADNGLAETQTGAFENGSLEIVTAETAFSLAEYIHGLAKKKLTLGSDEVTVVEYGDDTDPPYLGWGCVRKKQYKQKKYWDAIIFPKLAFKIPDEEADTEEESVDWQDTTESAKIMKSDAANHPWKKRSQNFSTEAEAIAFIKAYLNITDGAEDLSPEVLPEG